MKKFLLTSILLVAQLTLQAQTIRMGDMFFNGSVLYTVEDIRMGKYVYMTGVDGSGNGYEMTLEKVSRKPGEYTLQPSSQADDPPVVGAEFGWRVQYVRREGMYFLAVRKPNGDAMDVFVLTPDNLEDNLAHERDLEKRLHSEILSIALLNATYLSNIDRSELRLMRNEILARHGYRFMSKDLREYFGGKSWYKPCANNNSIRLSVIEQTNVELIKSQEALPMGTRPADSNGISQ